MFENDFRLLFGQAAHFSTKNLINTPSIHIKRFLIADVFHFLGPVQKDD